MKQQMLRFFTGIICILSSTLLNAATPTISDTIDIRHITINLDITDYDDNTINGWAELDVKILVDNITMLPLDLLGSFFHISANYYKLHCQQFLIPMIQQKSRYITRANLNTMAVGVDGTGVAIMPIKWV